MDMRALAMGVAFALMWSSAFTSAKIIVADASPLYALAIRFLLSGLIGIALARMLGQTWHLTRAQWQATLVFGICQNALYLGLNFVAMQTVEASVAAIIASAMPLMVGLFSWLFWGENLGIRAALGLLAGVAGVALVMGSRIQTGVELFGLMLCGLGVLALTLATLAVRGASSGGNFLMVVGLQMLVGAVALFAVAIPFETPLLRLSWPLVMAFAYTTLMPGLVATLVWFVLVDRIGAIRAATFHFLNPFFGVTIAAVLLREWLGVLDLIGVIVITISILIVQLEYRRNS
ncbi:MAG: DMT family transporter [Rhodobacteraceae bacterium]|nr:DMT family transporter [Paracoccaceae bacterium]